MHRTKVHKVAQNVVECVADVAVSNESYLTLTYCENATFAINTLQCWAASPGKVYSTEDCMHSTCLRISTVHVQLGFNNQRAVSSVYI